MRVTRFRRCERGTTTYMGLVFLLMTLLVGGVAVDVMRHEGTRSHVQRALDACTANVAAVERPKTSGTLLDDDPTLVDAAVTDCMTRLGLGGAVSNVTATSSGGFASLATTASGTQTNQFMQMLNIETLDYSGTSAAALPGSGGVDVILAFESSNAMTARALITPFRTGATAFVDSLMQTDADSAAGTRTATSIGLVPYSYGVNLSSALLARYNVTNLSNLTNANCIDIPTADFATAAMSTTTAYQTMIPVDMASTTLSTDTTYRASNLTSAATVLPGSAACPANAAIILRTPTNVASTIKNFITATQFTSGLRWDHGMHWASAMLHPGTNAAISNVLPISLAGRPMAYNTAGAQKVIVFVNSSGTGSTSTTGDTGDGSLLMLADSFATGLSPIWRNTANPPLYCIELAARAVSPRFYRPDNNTWSATCPGSYTRLTWPQVWGSVRAQWVAWQLYARGLQTTSSASVTSVRNTFDTIWPTMQQRLSFETQTSRFQSECTAAKANGVVIYTVALDAISRAKPPLQACATSPAHYFDATTANFTDVMKLIAQTINQQAYSQW